MNKFKKIGLTALAGSLVATSAYAGAVSVSGGASMGVKNNSGKDGGKSWTMGNQLTFSGSGELDNGLNVSISCVLDQGDNETDAEAGASEAPFDSHSITVSSDSLGSMNMFPANWLDHGYSLITLKFSLYSSTEQADASLT